MSKYRALLQQIWENDIWLKYKDFAACPWEESSSKMFDRKWKEQIWLQSPRKSTSFWRTFQVRPLFMESRKRINCNSGTANYPRDVVAGEQRWSRRSFYFHWIRFEIPWHQFCLFHSMRFDVAHLASWSKWSKSWRIEMSPVCQIGAWRSLSRTFTLTRLILPRRGWKNVSRTSQACWLDFFTQFKVGGWRIFFYINRNQH